MTLKQLRMNTYAIGDLVRIFDRDTWRKPHIRRDMWQDCVIEQIDWWWNDLLSGEHITARIVAVVINDQPSPHSWRVGTCAHFFARDDEHVFRLTPHTADRACASASDGDSTDRGAADV